MAEQQIRKIVIGIDSSLSCTGVGVVEIRNNKPILLEYFKIQTNEKEPYENRCLTITREVFSIIQKYVLAKDQVHLAIELLNSPKNLDTTRKLSGLWGHIICYVYGFLNIRFQSINTSSVKKEVTGDGSADKTKVIKKINSLFKTNFIYNNNKEKSDDDIADAIAVAICYYKINKGKFNDKI